MDKALEFIRKQIEPTSPLESLYKYYKAINPHSFEDICMMSRTSNEIYKFKHPELFGDKND